DSVCSARFQETAGTYLSRFYKWLKEKGEIWANKCPKCGRIVLPPRIVCGFCKVRIEDKEENWVKLKDTGVVIQCFSITDREVNRVTKELMGDPNPNAVIRLDGGDEFSLFAHLLEEEVEANKLELEKVRVQAVWKPKGERVGKISDIRYFKIIGE
ncbi:Zn-ribbon domain-containing OB-fold protein, partial [Chloroflexota bacterium]